MADSNELPQKCLECAGSKKSSIHSNCDICHELEFQESVLCDLNRCIQEKADFRCHAFRQALKLVGPSEYDALDRDVLSVESPRGKSSGELFHSDKIKYERALALQKLGRDPDSIILQLKYHFAWNVSKRMPVFASANDFIGYAHDTFQLCSEAVQGFVHLLFLAPDHVHLYVESDGERSVEDMVSDIKKASAGPILEEFAVLRDKLGRKMDLWDEAYFVETVG
jgi:REP element-mobilizing transposase RayT